MFPEDAYVHKIWNTALCLLRDPQKVRYNSLCLKSFACFKAFLLFSDIFSKSQNAKAPATITVLRVLPHSVIEIRWCTDGAS